MMIDPLFKDIVDRIFVQDSILHKIVQSLKEDKKEKTDDAVSEDTEIL